MYVDNARRAAFILHPRAASTSLSSVFNGMNLKLVGTKHGVSPEILRPDWKVGCVVRNVFDTLVSWYYVRRHFEGSFHDWLEQESDFMWLDRGMFYGLPYATHVLRFEHLQDDFDMFCDEVGWPRTEIPHRGKGKVRDGKPFQEVIPGMALPEIKITGDKDVQMVW